MEEWNDTDVPCPPLPVDGTPILRNGSYQCWNLSFPNSTYIYTCCDEDEQKKLQREFALFIGSLYFYLSVVSVGLLLITFIVLIRFKSIQNTRITIHKNLIASFILRFVIKSILFGRSVVFPDVPYPIWLCNALFCVYQFSKVSNFSWMFVEGLHLHFILVMRPFRRESSPCLLFYFIGWVLPCLLIICWVIVMNVNQPNICWYAAGHERLLITGPIIFVLLVNLVILLNLIRIVIAKLCNENVTECRKVWQTIKSTIVLGFLLGTINIILIAPLGSLPMYIPILLPFTQGIFVALYCITNIEIRKAMKRWWVRYRDSRSMSSSGYRGRLSRTSVTLVVTNQINTIDLEEGNTTELLSLPTKEGQNGIESGKNVS
ncbi:unnamed protein product [Lymnaea stagnalis]|uniref:G-protein coupled receptors family 2 profile 2 domain-containing protein n=1 Tax=Lymnaea stagnalis TaxID=6523 RepID=A0AAV2H681_LYMST